GRDGTRHGSPGSRSGVRSVASWPAACLGLSDAGADAGLSMWTAGSAGARLLRSYLNQFRELIKGGHITADEFHQDWNRLDEPDFFTIWPTLWGAWGRVPTR